MDFFTFLQAVAIFLVLEGIFPLLSPSKWRDYIMSIASKDERFIRNMGMISVAIGVLLFILLLYFDNTYNSDFLMD